jgi:hypothetical protein
MKQILIITRINGNKEKDEFRRTFYENRKEPVVKDFNDLHLDIYSGFDLYDEEDDEVARSIQSKIDAKAGEVLIVIHSLEFDSVKSELISLQNGADWQIRKYSSEDGNYGEIKKAFREVLTDSSKVETINQLFSSDSILEAKLDLLHNCINPEDVPPEEDLDNLLSDFSGAFKSFKRRVEEIKKNIEKENLAENKTKELNWDHQDYLEALTKLRKSLLGS